jgi:hypothetical protein
MKIAMGAAQSAVAKDEMVKSVVQAYLTGGMAGIQSMVKDKIRDAFIDKVAEATGINPDLVRFATGRFEQAKLTKKMNNQAAGLGRGVGAVMGAGVMMAMGPVGPLMMAGPLGATALGAGAGNRLGSNMISGGTLRTTLNNPIVDAGLTMSSGLAGAMMGGPAGLVAGVAAKNKLMQSSSVVSNNNEYNALQQQENALIQDAAGAAVANAIGRPDAAGNFSQILGGLKKRQVAKKNNANLGKVASSGIASGMNMATGMVKGIVKNAIIAVGGSADTFDHLTANPFTPPATWTGAAKVDMSKDGWKDRIQEYATAEFLEANGMDADLAKTVASTTNAKIKAKKAKKEEKTKAIESTAQTALAVTAMVLTAGAAAPAVAGTASVGSYVQVASIALQAGIGSRTGGVEGAMAGAANGILQAFAGSLGTKEAGALKDKADEIGQQVNAGLMNMDEGVAALEAAKNAAKLANVGAKTLAATNVSYTKEDGWGIKANVTGLLSAVGVTQGGYGGSLLQRLTNVTIGQSQRGGASVNLGFNTPIGNMGINYTGATGTFGGSYDIMERQVGGLNLSSELSYDGEQGLSVSGNADFGNGLGLGAENGQNGATGSLTLLGSTQGTVNEDGVYEANGNFLGEISGQDIIDLHNTIAQQEGNATIEDAARNAPAKSAKDAANSNNPVDDRDNDAQEEAGSQGSEGLVDLVFAGTAVLVSAGAAFLAGGGSGSATPSSPAGGQGGAGNGGNATIARKPEDDEPPKKKRTKEELANFKDNVFLNTTRAVTDDYLNKLDAQGVDTKEMRAHAEAQRAAGVRDLTPTEIQAKREERIGADNQDPSKGLTSKELNDYKALQDKLRANKDLTPAEQERHAYLGKIRNIQLYSNAVSQDVPGGNGKRDEKNEIENARRGEGLFKLAQSVNTVDTNIGFIDKGGNPDAKNIAGEGKFNYKPDEQPYKTFGIECKSGTILSIYKSLGLLPPDMTRVEVEHQLTHLDTEPDVPKGYKDLTKSSTIVVTEKVFDQKYNRDMRGFLRYPDIYETTKNGEIKYDKDKKPIIKVRGSLLSADDTLSPEKFRDTANKLAQKSKYAVTTGMQKTKFEVTRFSSPENLIKHLNSGGVARAYLPEWTTADGHNGHYVVVTGIDPTSKGDLNDHLEYLKDEVKNKAKKRVIKVIADDNLTGTKREGYYTLDNISFAPDNLRQAWTLTPAKKVR